MNQTSIKVSLTLVAAAALLVVGWLSVVSMEQQQAHASACNIFRDQHGTAIKATGNLAVGSKTCTTGPGANNFHIHIPKIK